jgi:hypothetical protein
MAMIEDIAARTVLMREIDEMLNAYERAVIEEHEARGDDADCMSEDYDIEEWVQASLAKQRIRQRLRTDVCQAATLIVRNMMN